MKTHKRLTKSVAIAFLIPGFVISIIDAFMSIQSMVGVMQADSLIGYLGAVVVGMGLTIFAVSSPIWGAHIDRWQMQIVRYLLLAVDIGTSIVGAIWYGLMERPLRTTIRVEEMHFNFANTPATLGFVAFVLIIAWMCHMFGRAMASLDNSRRNLRTLHTI